MHFDDAEVQQHRTDMKERAKASESHTAFSISCAKEKNMYPNSWCVVAWKALLVKDV